MTKKREPASEVLLGAKVDLEAIAEGLREVKVRLAAIADRLRAAESTAAVVDVHLDDDVLTAEGWTADLLDDPGGAAGEAIDELLQALAHAVDTDAVCAEIRKYVAFDRKIDAGRAKG